MNSMDQRQFFFDR